MPDENQSSFSVQHDALSALNQRVIAEDDIVSKKAARRSGTTLEEDSLPDAKVTAAKEGEDVLKPLPLPWQTLGIAGQISTQISNVAAELGQISQRLFESMGGSTLLNAQDRTSTGPTATADQAINADAPAGASLSATKGNNGDEDLDEDEDDSSDLGLAEPSVFVKDSLNLDKEWDDWKETSMKVSDRHGMSIGDPESDNERMSRWMKSRQTGGRETQV